MMVTQRRYSAGCLIGWSSAEAEASQANHCSLGVEDRPGSVARLPTNGPWFESQMGYCITGLSFVKTSPETVGLLWSTDGGWRLTGGS